MAESSTPSRRTYRSFVPRYSLRALLVSVLLVAVLIPTGQFCWRRYILNRDRGLYNALQRTKDSYVLGAAKRRGPGERSSAVDGSRPIPDDFVVLLRKGNVFGCFIPRKQGVRGESLEYDWYFRTDGIGRFDAGGSSIQSGHTLSPAYTFGSELVRVEFGPFAVKWSGNGVGWGFLYYESLDPANAGHGDVVGVCTTNRTTLKYLDARNAEWIYKSYVGDAGIPGNVSAAAPTLGQTSNKADDSK